MADGSDESASALAPALELLAHDLRNPTSAIFANLAFLEGVRDLLPPDERDALADALSAVRDLMVGIEHLGWFGRALRGDAVTSVADADVVAALRTFASRTPRATLQHPDGPLRAHAASGLVRLLELLAANSVQHARGQGVVVRAEASDEHVVVTFTDAGSPMAPELRDVALLVAGQTSLKSRADGRYSRMLGLAAVGLLARAMDATVRVSEEKGRSAFVITLRRV